MVFPAAVAAAPAVAVIDVTAVGEYDKVHWTPAGSLPLGDVKDKLRETVPFVPAVPEDRAKVSVCPMAACVNNKQKAMSVSFTVDLEANVNMIRTTAVEAIDEKPKLDSRSTGPVAQVEES